jgi:[acyl-carrier-protein] S-malonyltransferase
MRRNCPMSQRIAFLFPGQGSQSLGMGKDLMDPFPDAKRIFEQVDEICKKPISKLCFEGPMEELTLTANLQPAITAVNLACLSALNKSGVHATVSAGHSLGEYAALASAGCLSEYDALRLVDKRGELMHREALANPGSMAAVLGMDIEAVGRIVAQASEAGVLAVANHNTAEQVVITGEEGPLSQAVDLVKEKGGKAIPLNVSGAWHCSLMKNAVDDFRRFMEDIAFSTLETSVLFNTTAQSESDPEKIKDLMARQLISPVKWYDIIHNMNAEGVNVFVEVGPKKVLTGLLKKILPPDSAAKVFNVENMKGLESFMGAMG